MLLDSAAGPIVVGLWLSVFVHNSTPRAMFAPCPMFAYCVLFLCMRLLCKIVHVVVACFVRLVAS